MDVEPNDEECIYTLKSGLEAMRAQPRNRPIPANGLCNTFQYITHYYLQILQVELCSNRNVMEFFVILVNSLTNPCRLGKVVYQGMPQPIRPCQLWERFAEYFIRFIPLDFLPHPVKLNVTHTGKSCDRGVDVFCRWGIDTHDTAVVQVKRGCYFKNGKGTDIVLNLLGSMTNSNAKIGIIFTNESYEVDVKADAKNIIRQNAMHRDHHIHILGENQIKYYAEQDAQSCINLMVAFIGRFLG